MGLQESPHTGRAIKALQRVPGLETAIVGYRRQFSSLAEAKQALGAYENGGHESTANVAIHTALSSKPRPSDYSVFYYLRPHADKIRSVFDLGGNVGNLYYYYPQHLDLPADLDWCVYDLPEVARAGADLARSRGATGLRFVDTLAAAEGADLYLASGSMHYWEQSLAEIVGNLARRPPLVVINRTPMTDAATFATVQDAGSFRVACKVWNRSQLTQAFERLGYRQVGVWETPERSLRIPFYDDQTLAYTGMAFVKN